MSQVDRERKRTNQLFRELMDRRKKHVRITPADSVTLVGHARDLHGPRGCCTCCPRGSR